MNKLIAEYYEAGSSSESGLFFASFEDDSLIFGPPKANTGLKAGLRSLRPYVPYMALKLPTDLDRRPSACPVIFEDTARSRTANEAAIRRRQSSPCVDSGEERRVQRRKVRLLSRDTLPVQEESTESTLT